MLFGEDLCGHHQRALIPALDRAQGGNHPNDCLAGSDISLKQPIHRLPVRHVRLNLRNDPLLCGCQLEGQRLNKPI